MAIDKNVESELDESADEEEDEEDEDEEEETSKRLEACRRQGLGRAREVAAAAANPGAMSSMRNTWTIAKRELRAYFDSPRRLRRHRPQSMLGLGVYFFFYQGGFWQVDRATMARLFDFAPGALCLVVPLVTMGVLAEEKRSGTIELLITMPVKDSEVILGKYLAALGLVHHPARSPR